MVEETQEMAIAVEEDAVAEVAEVETMVEDNLMVREEEINLIDERVNMESFANLVL